MKIYDKELREWLQQRFGLAVGGAEALAAFDRLPKEQQRIFLRRSTTPNCVKVGASTMIGMGHALVLTCAAARPSPR